MTFSLLGRLRPLPDLHGQLPSARSCPSTTKQHLSIASMTHTGFLVHRNQPSWSHGWDHVVQQVVALAQNCVPCFPDMSGLFPPHQTEPSHLRCNTECASARSIRSPVSVTFHNCGAGQHCKGAKGNWIHQVTCQRLHTHGRGYTQATVPSATQQRSLKRGLMVRRPLPMYRRPQLRLYTLSKMQRTHEKAATICTGLFAHADTQASLFILLKSWLCWTKVAINPIKTLCSATSAMSGRTQTPSHGYSVIFRHGYSATVVLRVFVHLLNIEDFVAGICSTFAAKDKDKGA